MEESMGIIGTLLGILLGGYMSWFLSREQRKHDLSKEKRELLLLKYEDLHKNLGELQDCVNTLVLQIISEAAWNGEFDAKAIKQRMPLEKITMLVEFYVPELKSDLEYINKQTTFLYEHVTKHIMETNKTQQFLAESAVMANELSKAVAQTVSSMKEKLSVNAGDLLENA